MPDPYAGRRLPGPARTVPSDLPSRPAAAASSGPAAAAFAVLRPTSQGTLCPGPVDALGWTPVVAGPAEPHVERHDLGTPWPGGPDAPGAGGGGWLRLIHVTDTHVMDAASPARSEWIEQLADDPRWWPLLHMARPHDITVNRMVGELVASVAAGTGPELAAVLLTGDNIDNAQRNELDAELALFDGGVVDLPYAGGHQDDLWTDDLRADDWAFWTPEDHRPDRFTRRGYPKVPGLLGALREPFRSPGVGVPWFAAFGNHDAMRQGTVYSDARIERIATGSWKMVTAPPGLAPDDPLADYLAGAHRYSEGGQGRAIDADPARRAITRAEFAASHGVHAPVATGRSTVDYEVALADGWRLVVLDTVHHVGHYQGSVSAGQLDWLDGRLADAHRAGDLVVLASHHGPATLDNVFGTPADNAGRRLAEQALAVVHRHGVVPAWLVGHRHVHEIVAHPDPAGRTRGVWEITTSSVIDWPCQSRLVELARVGEGAAVRTTVLDHGATDWTARGRGWIAALHRELALNVAVDPARRDRRRGGPGDRNAVLGW